VNSEILALTDFITLFINRFQIINEIVESSWFHPRCPRITLI